MWVLVQGFHGLVKIVGAQMHGLNGVFQPSAPEIELSHQQIGIQMGHHVYAGAGVCGFKAIQYPGVDEGIPIVSKGKKQ